MTHVEFPEVLVLAHQFLQLFLEIQSGGPTTLDAGSWVEMPHILAQLRVSMYSPGKGGLPILFALLGKPHHLDPLSLSLANSSLTPIPDITPISNPFQPPKASGPGLYLNCLCLLFSSSIWKLRAQIRSLHSSSRDCFLEEARQPSVLFSKCLS